MDCSCARRGAGVRVHGESFGNAARGRGATWGAAKTSRCRPGLELCWVHGDGRGPLEPRSEVPQTLYPSFLSNVRGPTRGRHRAARYAFKGLAPQEARAGRGDRRWGQGPPPGCLARGSLPRCWEHVWNMSGGDRAVFVLDFLRLPVTPL